jgi:hypothetical protein
MRLVTWSLGHRPNDSRCPDRLVTALASLAPDIVILVDRTAGAVRRPLLEALAGIGLGHQLATSPGPHDGRILFASRLDMVLGSLEPEADGDAAPSNVLHAFAPNGVLDVLGLGIRGCGRQLVSHSACWDWLQHAASTLKHRRAILIGDFETDPADDPSGGSRQWRRFMDDGWQHAVPAAGASGATAGAPAQSLDHAFLSPSLQRIDARYAREAAGFRLAGTKDALAERPALVVDLQ